MYKKILVPLDLSEYSVKALTHAEELARQCKAELILLHTLHYLTEYTWDFPAGSRDEGNISESQKKIAESFLTKIVSNLELKGIKATYMLRAGSDNAQEILDCVDQENIDLVVMMTHGRSTIRRFVMGSVTEKVLRGHSSAPIFLITSRAAEKLQ